MDVIATGGTSGARSRGTSTLQSICIEEKGRGYPTSHPDQEGGLGRKHTKPRTSPERDKCDPNGPRGDGRHLLPSDSGSRADRVANQENSHGNERPGNPGDSCFFCIMGQILSRLCCFGQAWYCYQPGREGISRADMEGLAWTLRKRTTQRQICHRSAGTTGSLALVPAPPLLTCLGLKGSVRACAWSIILGAASGLSCGLAYVMSPTAPQKVWAPISTCSRCYAMAMLPTHRLDDRREPGGLSVDAASQSLGPA